MLISIIVQWETVSPLSLILILPLLLNVYSLLIIFNSDNFNLNKKGVSQFMLTVTWTMFIIFPSLLGFSELWDCLTMLEITSAGLLIFLLGIIALYRGQIYTARKLLLVGICLENLLLWLAAFVVAFQRALQI